MVGWARRWILWYGRMALPRLMGGVYMVSGEEREEGSEVQGFSEGLSEDIR